MAMIVGVYGPRNVCLGPNSSVLIEPNTIFVQSVKVVDFFTLIRRDTAKLLRMFFFSCLVR